MDVLEGVHRWLESQTERLVDKVIELADLNSGSSNLDGLLRVADRLCNWQSLTQVTSPQVLSERVALPDRSCLLDDGSHHTVKNAPALLWRARPDAHRQVLLGIHYDTVYPPDHFPDRCVRLDGCRLRGPGVADAKGGIVVVRAALEAIERFKLAEDVGWTLLLTPDEEVGSPSTDPLWTELASTHDFGLLFEPAMVNGSLVGDRKGSGNFALVVRGQSAHAGRDFDRGRNAVIVGCQFASQLDALNGQRAGTTINVGKLAGGGPVNVVPDLAVVRWNVRVPTEEDQRWFTDCLSSLVASFQTRDGFSIEVSGDFTAPPKPTTSAQRLIMHAVEMAGQMQAQPVSWQSSGGVCDGNRLAAAGLPNIDTLGPIGDCLHSPNEWVDLRSLVPKAQMVATIFRLFQLDRIPMPSRLDRRR